ncbi:EamA family transporter [bacterium]|nr:EamA family transporter [bacterium]
MKLARAAAGWMAMSEPVIPSAAGGATPTAGVAAARTGVSPIAMALTAVFLGCVLDAVIKHLGAAYTAILIAACRYTAGALIAGSVFIAARKRLPPVDRLRAHALRALAAASSAVLFFHTLSVLTLAQATVVGFAAPLMIAPLASLLLKERMRPLAVVAILIGFAGVLIVVVGMPGLASRTPRWDGALAAIGAAVLYALQMVLLRQLAQREDALTNTLTGNVFPALYLLIPAILLGQAPAMADLPWFALLGLIGFTLWLLMARAYSMAPAQTLAPTEFSALVWSPAIGFFIFQEAPGLNTIIGGVVVSAAVALVIFDDARGRRRGGAQVEPSPTG